MFDSTDFPRPAEIAVNGVTLEVFEAGQENAGNPIVLCHGWPEHAFSWRHQMPALAAAGYHVIVPNQRGYGGSSCPEAVEAYDIQSLTGDLAALLDHFGYDSAVFAGHDWGANVVWSLAQLHPERVSKVIALSLPYQARGSEPWLQLLEGLFGPEHYMVDFNRRPGEADAVLDENRRRFLGNLFRKDLPPPQPVAGNAMTALACAAEPLGAPLMGVEELEVFDQAFKATGFTGSINWYRNLDRNWRQLEAADPVIRHPALMIYGACDAVPPSPTLQRDVPNAEVATLDCGHWIQQELPQETTKAMLDWLQ